MFIRANELPKAAICLKPTAERKIFQLLSVDDLLRCAKTNPEELEKITIYIVAIRQYIQLQQLALQQGLCAKLYGKVNMAKVHQEAQLMRTALDLDLTQCAAFDAQGWVYTPRINKQDGGLVYEGEFSYLPSFSQPVEQQNAIAAIHAYNQQALTRILVMPYFSGQTLLTMYNEITIKVVSNQTTANNLYAIKQDFKFLFKVFGLYLAAMRRMNYKNIAHCDLNVSNIICSKNKYGSYVIQFIDFEYARDGNKTVSLTVFAQKKHWLFYLLSYLYHRKFNTTEDEVASYVLINDVLQFQLAKLILGQETLEFMQAIESLSSNKFVATWRVSPLWLDQVAFVANLVLLFSDVGKSLSSRQQVITFSRQLECIAQLVLSSNHTYTRQPIAMARLNIELNKLMQIILPPKLLIKKVKIKRAKFGSGGLFHGKKIEALSPMPITPVVSGNNSPKFPYFS